MFFWEGLFRILLLLLREWPVDLLILTLVLYWYLQRQEPLPSSVEYAVERIWGLEKARLVRDHMRYTTLCPAADIEYLRELVEKFHITEEELGASIAEIENRVFRNEILGVDSDMTFLNLWEMSPEIPFPEPGLIDECRLREEVLVVAKKFIFSLANVWPETKKSKDLLYLFVSATVERHFARERNEGQLSASVVEFSKQVFESIQ